MVVAKKDGLRFPKLNIAHDEVRRHLSAKRRSRTRDLTARNAFPSLVQDNYCTMLTELQEAM